MNNAVSRIKIMTERANESTRETCPIHIWKHEVMVTAGVSVDDFSNWAQTNARLIRQYQAGEPVWMAAVDLRFYAEGEAKAKIADSISGRGVIRAALKAARVYG